MATTKQPSGVRAHPELTSDTRTETKPSVHTLLELLGDEYTRTVLRAVLAGSNTAPEIIAETNISKTTVYRRLDRLEHAGVLTANLQVEPDGNHVRRFNAIIDSIEIAFASDGLSFDLQERDHTSNPQTQLLLS